MSNISNFLNPSKLPLNDCISFTQFQGVQGFHKKLLSDADDNTFEFHIILYANDRNSKNGIAITSPARGILVDALYSCDNPSSGASEEQIKAFNNLILAKDLHSFNSLYINSPNLRD